MENNMNATNIDNLKSDIKLHNENIEKEYYRKEYKADKYLPKGTKVLFNDTISDGQLEGIIDDYNSQFDNFVIVHDENVILDVKLCNIISIIE
jgi:hypothetical protein